MAAPYRIHLFGIPQIFYREKRLFIKRKQPRHLLYFLVAKRKAVHRDDLLQYLWPFSEDPEEEKKRKTRLRLLLTHLERELPEPLIIRQDKETLEIDESRIAFVDYWVFTQTWKQAKHSLAKMPSAVETRDTLHTLIEAWHDEDTFLYRQDDDRRRQWQMWLEDTRDALDDARRHCAQALARYVSITGLTPENHDWMRKVAHYFPENENIQTIYLESLLKSGQGLTAKKYWRRLEQYWMEHHGGLPDNLQKMEARIFAKDLPSFQPPLPAILRTAEQQKILDRFNRGGALTISGPVGIGKSTLLRATINQIKATYPNLQDIRLEGIQAEENIPYKAVYNLLQDNKENLQPLQRLLSVEERQYFRQFVHSNTPEQLSMPFSDLLKNIFIHLVRWYIQQSPPFILYIENAHFLDPQTIDLVQELVEHSLFHIPQRLLVLTYIDDHKNLHLTRMLADKRVASRLQPKIQLAALTDDQIRLLVQTYLKETPQEKFLQEIKDYSLGNPSEIINALRYLRQKYTTQEILQMDSLPSIPSLLAAASHSLRGLPPEAQDLLYFLAATQRTLSLELLGELSGLDSARLLHYLAQLEEQNLVKFTPHNRHYQLAQKRLSYIFQGLSPAKRSQYHLKIAQVLEKRHMLPDAALLARHWEEAGKFKKAFSTYITAARYAFDLQSVDSALEPLARAGYLLPRHLDSLDIEQIYAFYALINEIAFSNDNAALLQTHYNNLANLLQNRYHIPLLQAVAHNIHSNAALATNNFAVSKKEAAQALQILSSPLETQPDIANIERTNACINQGVCLYMENHLAEALQCFHQALEYTRQPETENAQPEISLALLRNKSHALYQIGLVYLFMGKISQAMAAAREGMEDARHARWMYGQILHHSLLSGCHFMQGNFQQGLNNAQVGLELSKQLGTPRMEGYLHGYLSMNALDLGKIGTAWKHAWACKQHGERKHHDEIIAFGYRSMGNIFLRLNDFETAQAYYEKGTQLVSANNFMGLDCYVRSRISLSFQHFERGWPEIEAFINTPEQQFGSITGHTIFISMFAAAWNRRWEISTALAQRIQNMMQTSGHPVSLAPFFQLLAAERAWQEQNPAEAANLARQTLVMLQDAPAPWTKIMALNLLRHTDNHPKWQQALERILKDLEQDLHREENSLANGAAAELNRAWKQFCHLAQTKRVTL